MKTVAGLCFTLSLLVSFWFIKVHKNLPKSHNQMLEKDYIISKMNLYPPSASRLANILENRPEARLYFQLERNFTDIFSAKKYVNDYLDLFIFLLLICLLVNIFLADPRNSLLIISPSLISLAFHQADKTWSFVLITPILLYWLWYQAFSKNIK